MNALTHAFEAVSGDQAHCRTRKFLALESMVYDFWHSLIPSFPALSQLDFGYYTYIISISWFK